MKSKQLSTLAIISTAFLLLLASYSGAFPEGSTSVEVLCLSGLCKSGTVSSVGAADPWGTRGFWSYSAFPSSSPTYEYSAPGPPQRLSLFGEFEHDVSGIVSDPVFYVLTGSLLIAPLFLSQEDPEINEEWARNATADHIFEFGNIMGNAVWPFAASGIALTIGKLARQSEAADFGSDLMRAQILSGTLTLAFKGITNRRRPDGSAWSFPSGHTSTAFATAMVINRHFGLKFGVPAFMGASYVGLSRLQENKHFLSDVIAGAVLGGYVGLKVAGRRGDKPALSIVPSFAGAYGINVSLRF